MSDAPAPAAPKDLKTFGVIWVGQVISMLGSGLTNFALSIWVLRQTESVTQYTIIAVIAALPAFFAAPLAGALVDRWDRRTVLIVTDLAAGLTTLAIASLYYFDMLQIWHIYLSVIINAFFATFQGPAFIASLTMIVPRSQFGRVNGLLQFGQAGTTIAAPALGGLLYLTIGLWGVMLIDVVSFVFAVVSLLLVKIPNPPKRPRPAGERPSLFKEAAQGWLFIKERPALLHLLLYFAAINLVTSMCGIAIVPMVLRMSSEAGAGTVMGAVGVGMLIGASYMTATGGPKLKINGVLGGGFLFTFFIILAAIKPWVALVAVAVVLWHANIPIINGCSTVIWQTKTPPELQGRVFAMRGMIARFTVPIGDFSAGPLSDFVFEPAMAEGGALAPIFGPIIGTGPGRGIALMMMTVAILPMFIAAIGYLNPKIRNVETDLPDGIPPEDEAPAAAAETPAPAEDGGSAEKAEDGDRTDDGTSKS
ncbi:MAG: MFS transporter [Acidobacteriota bacterium]